MRHLQLLLIFYLQFAEAAHYPGFADFRKAGTDPDAVAALTRVEPVALVALSKKHPADAVIQWGIAEFLPDWSQRQAAYERALAASRTNTAIALRLACAAATNGRRDLARQWLKVCRDQEPSNAVPVIVEWWLEQGEVAVLPPDATVFDDHAAAAGRARIRALEALGYSPYSARRIGYNVDRSALIMLREAARQWDEPLAIAWLQTVARSMQSETVFILTELVGQSIEVQLGVEDDRRTALQVRRESLLKLIRQAGADVVPRATEPLMVQFFDEMFRLGEEAALKQLIAGTP